MEQPPSQSSSAFSPLRNSVFRLLWLAWFSANIALWMNEVAAAWLMTSLTDNKLLVAMVQAATTLPVFALGLASGALADIVDRRRYFAATQLWVTIIAVILAILSFSNALNPPLLLALVAANGIGMAMRLPVFAAIIPGVVPRSELPSALVLNSGAMNLSRIAGPVIAGALLAFAGSHYVFIFNAALSVASFFLILHWKTEPRSATLPGERFFAAMRVGIQHVAQSPPMRIIMVRVFFFFLQAVSLIALLPLIAKELYQGGPNTFTILLASMSFGAVCFVFLLPRVRMYFSRESMIVVGTCLHATSAIVVATASSLVFAIPAMVLSGVAWIGTANSFSTSAQLALPDWVRARGMSIYQMALMGGMAGGAMLWGYVANATSLESAIISAALLGPAIMLVLRFLGRVIKEGEDLTPVSIDVMAPKPAIDIGNHDGPIMVTIEYIIDPAQSEAFGEIMQETRRARLRQGALSWGLFRDSSEPDRFIEYFVDENWIEHQRRMERFTASDVGLRAKRLSYHKRQDPPQVRRYVAQ